MLELLRSDLVLGQVRDTRTLQALSKGCPALAAPRCVRTGPAKGTARDTTKDTTKDTARGTTRGTTRDSPRTAPGQPQDSPESPAELRERRIATGESQQPWWPEAWQPGA